jgi:hypothetical protein
MANANGAKRGSKRGGRKIKEGEREDIYKKGYD